jgi:hypothetical protein
MNEGKTVLPQHVVPLLWTPLKVENNLSNTVRRRRRTNFHKAVAIHIHHVGGENPAALTHGHSPSKK